MESTDQQVDHVGLAVLGLLLLLVVINEEEMLMLEHMSGGQRTGTVKKL